MKYIFMVNNDRLNNRYWVLLCFMVFSLLFIFFVSYENEKKNDVAPAFYHWQTHLQIMPAERQLMDSLKVKKLYVKFFDIDLNENHQPVPHAIVNIGAGLLNDLEIIPTIFITNRTFKNISQKNIEILAENIFQKINEINEGLPPEAQTPSPEIQFDCDWTKSTRDNYFYFLEYFNSELKTQRSIISATIRLHQLKYPDQTGIPPVDKGMLMFYNVGELDNWKTENSILDMPTAEKYLTPDTRYPIKIDLALPIFKWGVIFRNGELVYLVNNLNKKEVADTARFAAVGKNRYTVKKSTYLHGYYLYGGDLIRLEKIDAELLEKAAAKLARFAIQGKSADSKRVISFYHLDTTTLASFQWKDFKKVMDRF